MDKPTKEDCVRLLQAKAAQTGEMPKKSDFTDYEVMQIKAFLGPWPRALEAAGLKALREGDRLVKNREKRARAKARRTAAIKTDQA